MRLAHLLLAMSQRGRVLEPECGQLSGKLKVLAVFWGEAWELELITGF